jgi:hypothetical protein
MLSSLPIVVFPSKEAKKKEKGKSENNGKGTGSTIGQALAEEW